MPTPPGIRFATTTHKVGTFTLLRLPKEASEKLASRGQVAVRGTLNQAAFQTVLEPDGCVGHWMKVDRTLEQAADFKPGDTVALDLEPASEWPEPQVPDDLGAALAAAQPPVQALWRAITPMARWEWVRWVRATRNPETRQRRVDVTLSKLGQGKRRPCCFDLSACTDPDLARNGKLVELE